MTSKTGFNSNAAWKIGSTFGTAVAAGTGHKISAEITPNFNVTELLSRQIGSGVIMNQSVTRGAFAPTISVAMDLGYDNQSDSMIAQMLGTDTTSAEITSVQGDYTHTLLFSSTLNAKYGTLAYEDASATTMEFASCAVRKVNIKSKSVPGFMDLTLEMLANDATLSSSTNTNAVLAAATARGTELVALDFASTYRINAQTGGAVGSGDQYNITSYELDLNRPQEMQAEVKGSSGNSAPIGTDLIHGTLSIAARELIDHAFYTIWSAGTLQKSKLSVTGTQIGSGSFRDVSIYCPSMKLVQEPKYALTSNGTNTVSMSFTLLKASAAPTGMTGSTYPYFIFTNTLATSTLA